MHGGINTCRSVLATMNYSHHIAMGHECRIQHHQDQWQLGGGRGEGGADKKMEQLLQEKRKFAKTSLFTAGWPAGETHTGRHKRFRKFGVKSGQSVRGPGDQQEETAAAPQLFGWVFFTHFFGGGQIDPWT